MNVTRMYAESTITTERERDHLRRQVGAEWFAGRPVFEDLSEEEKASVIRLVDRLRGQLEAGYEHSNDAIAEMIVRYAAVEKEQEPQPIHPFTWEVAVLGATCGVLIRHGEGDDAEPMPSQLRARFDETAPGETFNPDDEHAEVLARQLRDAFMAFPDNDPIPAFFAPGAGTWRCVALWASEYSRLNTLSGIVAARMEVRETSVRVGYALASLGLNEGRRPGPRGPTPEAM